MMRFPALGLVIVADPPTTVPPVGPALQASDPQSRIVVLENSRVWERDAISVFLVARRRDEKESPVVPRPLESLICREIGGQDALSRREWRLQAEADPAFCRGGRGGRAYSS